MTNPNLVELAVVLDRSGSMQDGGKIVEARNSFNALIEEQRELPGNVQVSLVLFDDRYELIFDRASLAVVPHLTDSLCFPRGMTALLDAIGRTIDDMGKKLNALPEDERPAQVVLAIITDGLENASKEYTLEGVRERVARQVNDYSWDIRFLGAGLETMNQARLLNMPEAGLLQVANSGKGMRMAYATISDAVTSYRQKEEDDAA